MTKVGILIIHHRDSPYTTACLDSLAKITTKHQIKIYLLSQQSHGFTHPLKPEIVNSDQNLGFTGGNNLMIRRAIQDGCDAIVLLNNDTQVDSNFLDPLIDRLNEPSIGMVCPKIYFSPGQEYHHSDYQKNERGHVIWYAGGLIDWDNVYCSHWGVNEVDHGQFNRAQETQFATGCCLAIKTTSINHIGMFDDRYFLYLEDVDWSMRVKYHQLKIIFEPQSIIWHQNAGSSDGAGSTTSVYYQTRNRFLFGMKYASPKIKLHLLIQYLKYLKHHQKNIRQASLDALIYHYGKKTST